MELTYDWRGFQGLFQPQRRAGPKSAETSQEGPAWPVYVILEAGVVAAAYTEREDLCDCVGLSRNELGARFEGREIVEVSREDTERLLAESTALSHGFEQAEFLRDAVAEGSGKDPYRGRRHFLVETLRGRLSRILPSSYGVFVRVEVPEAGVFQDLFLLVRRTRLESFHSPDLTSMGSERSRVPAEVVKYLSEKHLVRVQGIVVGAVEWADWSQSEDPWRRLAWAVRSNRAKLVPFRWAVATGIAGRAFLRG